MSVPIDNYPFIETLLFISISSEIIFYLDFRASLYSLLLWAITFVFIQVFTNDIYSTAWFIEINDLSIESIFTMLYFICFSSIALLMLRRQMERTWIHKIRNQQLDDTVFRMAKANKVFQEYAISAKEKAEYEERKRISREIHDTVGYTMTNLIVMMESATDFAKRDPKKTENLLQQARQKAVEGLENIRYSLRQLRKIGVYKTSLASALYKMVKTFQDATGTNVSIEYGNIPKTINEEIDVVIYHIIQEGLINAFRHGHANKIIIHNWITNSTLSIKIRDNGIGASYIKEGLGLSSMKERLEKIHGSMNANNIKNGFEISIEIPIPKDE
jgi:signal transduction histidine kinase